jgi:PAS domain S-box-containing protein
MKRSKITLVILLLLILWVLVAWFITLHKFSTELEFLVKNEQIHTQKISNEVADSISRNLHYIAGIPDTFQHASQLWSALNKFGANPQPTTLPKIEAIKKWNADPTQNALSKYSELIRSSLHVDLVFVVNAAGDCIASSNWDKANNLMGTNYTDRKWFVNARNGKSGIQYAVGRVTHIPGMFFATPMMQDGKFLGVVITKVDLTNLEFLTKQTDSYVVDENGVIILAHDKEMEMMSLAGAGVNQMSEKANTDLYLRKNFPELKIEAWKQHNILKRIKNESFPHVLASTELIEYNLKVFSKSDLPAYSALEHEQFSNFLLLSIFGDALILISYAFLSIRNAKNLTKESEARLRLILESANCGIWGQSTEGVCTFINAEASRMLAYGPNELVGKSLYNTLHHNPSEGAKFAMDNCPMDATAKDGKPRHVDNEVLWRKDGKSFPVEYATSAIYTNNDLDGCVVVFNDISERKQQELLLQSAREKAESANRAKSEFLANMSHEIRTPMNAVIGFTDLAIESVDPDEQRGYLKQIKDSSISLLGIINDILDLSKIEAGQMSFEENIFDLDALLSSLNRMFSLRAHEKSLDFKLIKESDIPRLIIGDQFRIRQILTNLLGNALKFTSKGGVEFIVHKELASESAISLEFCIQDTGIGMTAEQLANLFQAFMQADNTISRRFGGTGLGLNISRNLAKLMGGNVIVESNPGVGSAFRFQITLTIPNPIQLAEYIKEHEEINTPPKSLSDCVDLRGKRVLLVEDNRVNQMLASHILKKLGMLVEVANNGEESIACLNRASYDVVLMDIQMPVMNGLEATRLIRKDPRFASLPIVAMSAGVTLEEQSACDEVGMTGFIGKPIDTTLLTRKLVELCLPNVSEGI